MVDHASNYSYSLMIRGTIVEETVEAKHAYERLMSAYRHRVGSYHADNSRFDSQEFQHSCQLTSQTYSYCSVGAHHQNGIAK
eukprot:2262918-Ditylum_brightwellii.AAC.1